MCKSSSVDIGKGQGVKTVRAPDGIEGTRVSVISRIRGDIAIKIAIHHNVVSGGAAQVAKSHGDVYFAFIGYVGETLLQLQVACRSSSDAKRKSVRAVWL